MRRLGSLALISLLAVAGCGAPDDQVTELRLTPEGNRLNVLLIVSDALRADMLGCYGGPVATPNLDRLAASGVRFGRAHATAPWTSPSAVSLMTGNHASVYESDLTRVVEGRRSFYVPNAETTLPEHLAAAGYDLVFNSHNPNSYISNNFQGFRKLVSDTAGTWEPALSNDQYGQLRAAVGLARRWEVHRRIAGFLNYLLHVPERKAFFGVCWINDPHAPYAPHGEFRGLANYPPEGLVRNRHYYSQHTNLHLFDAHQETKLTPQEEKFFFDLYQAEVASMDERVGFILEILEQRGLADRTLVIFTSDHGEAFNEHGQFEHGRSYYQELVHVPLIVSGPGLPAGAVVPAAVSHLGLMPTVRDLLALDCDLDCQGESFRNELIGRPASVRPLYFEAVTNLGGNDFRDAAVHAGFKLVTNRDPGAVELYNLRRDPRERENLADREPDRVARMLELLEETRSANAARQAALGRGPDADSPGLDDREKAEMLKKLKSLGYVN